MKKTPRPGSCAIHVGELRRRLGQRREVAIDIELEEQVVVGSRTLPPPVVGTLMIESIERGVSATGTVRFEWEGDCRRCLEPVQGLIDVSVAEIFQIDAPEDSELIDFDGENVDLLPIIRDAVALSLPLAPLCRDECAGSDPERYPALTAEQAAAAKAEEEARAGLDPRWAALDELDLG